jgi:hypothetical protein
MGVKNMKYSELIEIEAKQFLEKKFNERANSWAEKANIQFKRAKKRQLDEQKMQIIKESLFRVLEDAQEQGVGIDIQRENSWFSEGGIFEERPMNEEEKKELERRVYQGRIEGDPYEMFGGFPMCMCCHGYEHADGYGKIRTINGSTYVIVGGETTLERFEKKWNVTSKDVKEKRIIPGNGYSIHVLARISNKNDRSWDIKMIDREYVVVIEENRESFEVYRNGVSYLGIELPGKIGESEIRALEDKMLEDGVEARLPESLAGILEMEVHVYGDPRKYGAEVGVHRRNYDFDIEISDEYCGKNWAREDSEYVLLYRPGFEKEIIWRLQYKKEKGKKDYELRLYKKVINSGHGEEGLDESDEKFVVKKNRGKR